jgi:hypothetical protein
MNTDKKVYWYLGTSDENWIEDYAFEEGTTIDDNFWEKVSSGVKDFFTKYEKIVGEFGSHVVDCGYNSDDELCGSCIMNDEQIKFVEETGEFVSGDDEYNIYTYTTTSGSLNSDETLDLQDAYSEATLTFYIPIETEMEEEEEEND